MEGLSYVQWAIVGEKGSRRALQRKRHLSWFLRAEQDFAMQRKEKRCFRQPQHARTQAQMKSGVVSGDTGWSSDPAYQCWLNVHEQPLQLGGAEVPRA